MPLWASALQVGMVGAQARMNFIRALRRSPSPFLNISTKAGKFICFSPAAPRSLVQCVVKSGSFLFAVFRVIIVQGHGMVLLGPRACFLCCFAFVFMLVFRSLFLEGLAKCNFDRLFF